MLLPLLAGPTTRMTSHSYSLVKGRDQLGSYWKVYWERGSEAVRFGMFRESKFEEEMRDLSARL